MADRTALGVIGYILGAVTAAVMVVGLLVVSESIAAARDATPGLQAASSSAVLR